VTGEADLDLAKLIKMLGMLGSAHDGERDTAARFVAAWMKRADITWDELLALELPPTVTVGGKPTGSPQKPPEPPPPPPPPPPQPPPPTGNLGTWQACAVALLQHYPAVLRNVGAVRNDEKDFIEGRLQWGRPLTPAQERWMRDIAARAGLTW
jgi:hypothetical protein